MERTEPRLILKRMSDVEPVAIDWLWPGWVPLGKLSILAGPPGVGKSLLTVHMASQVSTGSPWYDCPDTPNPRGRTLLVACEDGLADTVRPRLDAAGADCTMIECVDGVGWRDGFRGDPFSLDRHLPLLEAEIARLGDVRLVVFDPLNGYMGGRDTFKEADVREVLQPLAAMAERTRVAVVGLCHHRKDGKTSPLNRIMGSAAYGAVARSVMMVDESADDPDLRYLVAGKSSNARKAAGLMFTVDPVPVTVRAPVTGEPRVENVGRLKWVGRDAQLTAAAVFPDETAGGATVAGRGHKTRAAASWLAERLRDGPRPVSELGAEAKAAGHSLSTLYVARRQLGVVQTNNGPGTPWTLALPHTETAESVNSRVCSLG